MLSAASSVGTASAAWVGTPSSWRALTTLACWPAQRAKKSDSAPVALTVSMFCSPADGDALQDAPCRRPRRRLTSARRRETARSARRLASANTTDERREEQVVAGHEHEVEDDRDRLRRLVASWLESSSAIRSLRLQPGDDVAGVALREERRRQPQRVRQEARRHRQRELRGQAQQGRLLEPGQRAPRPRREREPGGDRQQPASRAGDEDLVHEDLQERGRPPAPGRSARGRRARTARGRPCRPAAAWRVRGRRTAACRPSRSPAPARRRASRR